MKKYILIISLSFLQIAKSDKKNELWFDKPAKYFEEAFLIGNGKMGATVFSGITGDSIFFNDATLWSGEPVNTSKTYGVSKFLDTIRHALKNEDYELAEKLNKNIQGPFSNCFLPLGTMTLKFKNNSESKDFKRSLDILNAVSSVNYSVENIKYSREYFISNPDKIMTIKLKSSKKGALNFTLKYFSLLKNTIKITEKTIICNGKAPVTNLPSYVDNTENGIKYDEHGTRFTSYVKIKNKDGKVIENDSTITLKNGTEAYIYISEATSFNGFDKDPNKDGLNNDSIAKKQLLEAELKNYEAIKTSHITDYQNFFNRVKLHITNDSVPNSPINQRLIDYSNGKIDKNLEVLYFQYGRYLLISSSRTKGVPANLQGIWNPYLQAPWSSNYTLNINAEMNYWSSENTNLSEMHLPLLDFIKNLSKVGESVAKDYYNVNEGWVACHNSDIWAMCNPVGNFGKGDPSWANWNMGGTWLSTHLWEHFLFTQDTVFLKREAYQVLKGATKFCLAWLVSDKNGNLITSPSTSPENKFVTDKGFIGATCYGGTADIAMIRQCLNNFIDASKLLNLDRNLREEAESASSKLLPYKIGKNGNLQEWYFDWKEEDSKHRHQSHLFGLFPANQITPQSTPDLADACRKTLEIKGDETTGWSKSWRLNLWARLKDGNRTYKLYRELLKYVDPDGVPNSTHRGGGTYPNLLDAHPPFQIDGNFGGTAAVAEMLVQSQNGVIEFLPALPDAWETGSVSGLKVRGAAEVSLIWSKKTINKISIKANINNTYTLNLPNEFKAIKGFNPINNTLIVKLLKNQTATITNKEIIIK